jgi:hypothetical protein
MSNPLVVPIDVEALVVTKAYQKTQALRRWPFNYNALGQYDSPEPRAGQGQASMQPPAIGAHLRWTLPAALRRGVQTPAPAGGVQTEVGDVTYPPVPNRWLIVRLAGAGGTRAATAWVLESDCPNADSPTQYLVDAAILAAWTASSDRIRSDGAASVIASAQGGPPVAPLGHAFPAAGWAERAADTTFLTAVAPGNAAFAAYQPHHDNVFAFTDPLDGVADGDQLTYAITGWYSNAAEDPLGAAAKGDPDAVRSAFGWTLDPETERSGVDSTLLHGLAFGVPWTPGSDRAPPSPLADLAGRVTAAVGMTDIDALTALIAAQPGARGPDASVLQAFQYGLLTTFEQVNGPALLAQAVHQAGFATRPGGTRWTIAPASTAPGEDAGASAPLTADEARWLLELNAAQDTLDAAVLTRDSARWALYAMWWKEQKGLLESQVIPVEGFDPDVYATVVGTTLPAAIAVAEQAVTTALADVPQPAPQPGDTREQAFGRGVAAFAASKGLDDTKVLKAVPGPRYWRASDPVVLLSGLAAPPALDPSAPVACRLATGLVTQLVAQGTPITAAALGAVVPAAPASAAPATCAALLAEAFLLDAASAASIGSAVRIADNVIAAAIATRAAPAYDPATLPALGLAPWTAQPWAPLYMEWQVDHLDIPYATGGVPNWAFDGNDYAYTGPFGPFPADPAAPLQAVGGISLLTPQTQYTFRRRLERFLDVYLHGAEDPPATLAELAALDAEVETIDRWQLMSQALTGYGDLVANHDTRAHIAPDATVAATVAGQTDGVPAIDDGSARTFAAVRQGQFAFTSLLVYDAFGQVLQVVGGTGLTDPQTFAPVREPTLLPTRPAITRNPQRLVQLPPRAMQPARLEFLLVDATDDTRVVGTSAGANPVGGWVLPNHLDRSLLLYAPDGTALGSFLRLVGEDGTATATWEPPPHTAMTLTDVRARAPRVAAMIGEPALADPATFLALLDTIDATLWSTDPLGNRADVNLSVLIGRPLALVRARLDLALDGPPIGDLSPWENVWPPPEPDFTSSDHAVRLGDLATRADGLIGYFAGEQTTPFNSVPPPGDGAPAYLRAVGPIGATKDTNYITLRFAPDAPQQFVTMLVDPRASITATTGLLPAKTLTVPPAFVDGPLAALEIAFTANALPTTIVPTPGTTPPPANPLAVGLPLPIEQGGTWAWWERSVSAPGGWASFDLARATPGAALTDLPTTVRDGYLQLTADLAPPTPPPSPARDA